MCYSAHVYEEENFFQVIILALIEPSGQCLTDAFFCFSRKYEPLSFSSYL